MIVGYGMVGRNLVDGLRGGVRPFVVIDDREEEMALLRSAGVETVVGNAADTAVLDAANVARAGWLFVAIPNVFEAGQVIERARKVNPAIRITARAENEAERAHLQERGADDVVIGRREIALGMLAEAFGSGERDPLPPPA